MRAFHRYILTPLLVAATAFSIAGPAHFAAGSAHSGIKIVSNPCPNGTNWDVVIQGCA
jgi:hypothetical protein